MSNIKTTDWFNGAKFVPYHIGEYETNEWSDIFECYPKRYWNGEVWSFGYYITHSKGYAFRQISPNQNQQWRGIKKLICPLCKEDHSLSQCPRWKIKLNNYLDFSSFSLA